MDIKSGPVFLDQKTRLLAGADGKFADGDVTRLWHASPLAGDVAVRANGIDHTTKSVYRYLVYQKGAA
ncbi:hypothetical protein JCM9743_10310 [Natrinema sp. JCM 9743]